MVCWSFVIFNVLVLILKTNLRTGLIYRSSTWKFCSIIIFTIWFIKSICSAISSRFTLSRYQNIFLLSKWAHINSSRSSILQRLIAIMRYSCLIQYTVVLTVEIIFVLGRIADTSIDSLFSNLWLCHSFWNGIISSITSHEIFNSSHPLVWILYLIKVLPCHHHWILVWCLSILVHHIKHIASIWVSCTNSIILIYWTFSVWGMSIKLIKCIVFTLLVRLVCPWFCYKVTVEHCLSHLLLSYLLRITSIKTKATNSSLIKHLLLLFWHIRQHFMNPWIISWL